MPTTGGPDAKEEAGVSHQSQKVKKRWVIKAKDESLDGLGASRSFEARRQAERGARLEESLNTSARRFWKLARQRSAFHSGIKLLGDYGRYFWSNGDERAALEAFAEAVRLAPRSAGAHNDLAVFFWKMGNRVTALEHFRRARDLDPNHRDTVWNCGQIMIEAGELLSAKYLYGSYLKDNGYDDEISLALAEMTALAPSVAGAFEVSRSARL